MDFLKEHDFSEEQRESYYKNLEVDVDEMTQSFKNNGINVTMIAEKPSVAQVIAKVLSNNQCKMKRFKKFTRYEYYGKFRGIKAFFTVVYVNGHIYR